MSTLLEHEGSLLMDIHEGSSLCVLAEGLGMDNIVYSLLKIHSDPHNLVLVTNFKVTEARFLCELLKRDNVMHEPSIITAEVNNKDRERIYKRGGVVFVTSRILVVDLLMDRMPATLVSTVIMLRVHELQEACQDGFAVRLLREKNPKLEIKALSDYAVSLTSGYNHTERILTQLGIPKLVLWPRFNIQVMATLRDCQPQVEEIRVQFTDEMNTCQSCILDLIKLTIKELADQNPSLNNDDITLENALLPNFDSLLGLYLDPLWSQMTSSSRRLVGDLTSLRRLLSLLVESDAVAFWSLLEQHRKSALISLGVVGSERSGSHRPSACPNWFLMDQADQLLVAARKRVEGRRSSKGYGSDIEMNPKWKSLLELLKEILLADKSDQHGPVLILVGRENVARLLERYLSKGGHSMRRYLMRYFDIDQTTLPVASKTTTTATETHDSDSSSSASSSRSSSPSKDQPAPPTLPLGCREVEINPRLLINSNKKAKSKTAKPPLPRQLRKVIIRVPPTQSSDYEEQAVDLTVQPPTTDSSTVVNEDFIRRYGHRLAYVLATCQPSHVIMYEPRVGWVRELELYAARRSADWYEEEGAQSSDAKKSSTTPMPSLHVFFMLYEHSVEEQRYLTSLRREKDAFESLIKLKSTYVPVKDLPPTLFTSDLATTSSSSQGQSTSPQQPCVLVDMREFRSELPALLHRKGLKVQPVTLTIADYILAPHLCVERKSISDLIGSLKSGRLYQQCVAMSRHYPNPVLLIEFSMPNKVYNLSSSGGGYRDPNLPQPGFSLYSGRHAIGVDFKSNHLLARLTLLTIHFPNLRLIWSVTPYCSAELFAELKQGRAEPSLDKLPQDGEHLEDHNVEAVDMLLTMPGVSWKNYRRIMASVNSIRELAQLDLDRLTSILDNRELATKLHQFLHSSCKFTSQTPTSLDSTVASTSSSNIATSRGKRGPRFDLIGRVKTSRGRGGRPTTK